MTKFRVMLAHSWLPLFHADVWARLGSEAVQHAIDKADAAYGDVGGEWVAEHVRIEA